MIWSGIWYYYMRHNAEAASDAKWYICTGLFLSGLAVLIIGILVGRIGKEGKNADVAAGTLTAAAAVPNKDNGQPQAQQPAAQQPVAQQPAVQQPAVAQAPVAAPAAPVATQAPPGTRVG